jgi:hypothetical protein
LNPHPLEWIALGGSVLACMASAYLFTLKILDLMRVKREKQNGPMLFMTSDNVRRQGFTMAVSAGMLMAAVSSVNNPIDLTSQAMTLLLCLSFVALAIALESVFIYRRREKLARLIALYEGRIGGKRATDPEA